jgi:hypothetical protein
MPLPSPQTSPPASPSSSAPPRPLTRAGEALLAPNPGHGSRSGPAGLRRTPPPLPLLPSPLHSPYSGEPPRSLSPSVPPPGHLVHRRPKPTSAAHPAASSPLLLAGNGDHPEMRRFLLSSWVGRPSREVAGRAGYRRRGEPLLLPGARASGRLKTQARRAPPPRGPPVSGPQTLTWISGGVFPQIRLPQTKAYSSLFLSRIRFLSQKAYL